MGITQNVHTGGNAPAKAEAERIATLRARSLSRILEASASFDEAGRHYWESEFKPESQAHLKASAEACTRAFNALEQAREGLLEASQADVHFEEEHKTSPRLLKAFELGLNEYEYKPQRFLAERLAYDRRIIDLIDHLLTMREGAIQSLADGDLKALYRAVSSVSRQLLDVAADHLKKITAASRITHEVAYTVEMVWAMEGQADPTRREWKDTAPKDFSGKASD